MQPTRPLVILGGSGFAAEAVWAAESMNAAGPAKVWDILGYIEIDPALVGRRHYGFEVFDESLIASLKGREIWYHCGIGANDRRQKVSARMDGLGWHAATLIHPSVIQARGVVIGEGTYVGAGSILSPGARIGRHVLINQRVAVGHDTVLGDFSQACPGAQINGFCRLGEGALIGSNASMHPKTALGDHSVLGANSFLTRSVGAHVSALGVPAKAMPSGKP